MQPINHTTQRKEDINFHKALAYTIYRKREREAYLNFHSTKPESRIPFNRNHQPPWRRPRSRNAITKTNPHSPPSPSIQPSPRLRLNQHRPPNIHRIGPFRNHHRSRTPHRQYGIPYNPHRSIEIKRYHILRQLRLQSDHIVLHFLLQFFFHYLVIL